MVVHFWDASAAKIRPPCTYVVDDAFLPSANLAVVCTRRLERLTLSAPPVLLPRRFHRVGGGQGDEPSIRYRAGIRETCSSICDPYACYEGVKIPCLLRLERVRLQILKQKL